MSGLCRGKTKNMKEKDREGQKQPTKHLRFPKVKIEVKDEVFLFEIILS